MLEKSTKITVWIDNSPGGIAWDLSRSGMAKVCSQPEGAYSTPAVLIIPKPKKTKP